MSENEYEIREYETYYVVSTTYDLDKGESTGDGFRKLFNYISGENKSAQKIEMTAPVTITQSASKRKITFMVPSRFYNTSIPVPTNPDVKIEKIEKQTRAVIKFSWFAGDEKQKKMTQKLLDWLKKTNYTPIGKPFYAGYNSPYTLPWLKTNEILVRVKSNK